MPAADRRTKMRYASLMMKSPSQTVPARHRLALLFTGHMTDAPDRPQPRFPPRMEAAAADAILAEIRTARDHCGNSLIGIASGARGGDILFHEACAAEGIATQMVLPFAVETFLDSSVRGVPLGNWEPRFKRLWEGHDPHRRTVLDLADEHDPFGACNEAMLTMARASAGAVELLALWDGEGAARLGGTAAFVAQFCGDGGRFHHIDSKVLLAAMKRWQRQA